MKISNEILDELLKDYKTAPDLFAEGEILKQLSTALIAMGNVYDKKPREFIGGIM